MDVDNIKSIKDIRDYYNYLYDLLDEYYLHDLMRHLKFSMDFFEDFVVKYYVDEKSIDAINISFIHYQIKCMKKIFKEIMKVFEKSLKNN